MQLEDDPELEKLRQEARDEEIDSHGVPDGWVDCPPCSKALHGIVAVKVPLSGKFDAFIPPDHRFSTEMAGRAAVEALDGAPLGLAIDLTRSKRYYDMDDWRKHGVQYLKIACRGRGEAPEPEAVNDFCFELARFFADTGGASGALVHCTHGFNRTGFMLCSYLVRQAGMPVWKAVLEFAAARPPGIYKAYYIRELFKRFHEEVPDGFPFPGQPEWKGPAKPDSPDRPEGADADAAAAAARVPHHDDVFGDPVGPDEAAAAASVVMDLVRPGGGDDGPQRRGGRAWFPGSQPVSLARSNVSLLAARRYWVTWKADGTRYMLLVLRTGTYLIDRKLAVRRLQLRFPMRDEAEEREREAARRAAAAAGKPPPPRKPRMPALHDGTLMDGELVVDEDKATGTRSVRFLAYDLMALNGRSLVHEPWKTRFALLQHDVMGPRQRERDQIERDRARRRHEAEECRKAKEEGKPAPPSAPAQAYPYLYEQEEVRVRRKEFYPLSNSKTLLDRFIPALPHESDGLIFQGYDDPYILGTCEELLKWKFPSLNSVDFRLRVDRKDKLVRFGDELDRNGKRSDGAAQDDEAAADAASDPHGYPTDVPDWVEAPSAKLELLETRQDAPRGRGCRALPDARVLFPPSMDPRTMDLRIIECTWHPDYEVWLYLRDRRDKDTPNAYHVFEKVQDSILRPVSRTALLQAVTLATRGTCYANDRAREAHRGK